MTSSTEFATAVNASVSSKMTNCHAKLDAQINGQTSASGKAFNYSATQTVCSAAKSG